MQKHNIIKLLGIQGVLVKNIKESENYLEINIETKRKFVKCPCCQYLTNKVHDYIILWQKILRKLFFYSKIF